MVERRAATIRNQATGVIDLQSDEALAYNGYSGIAEIQNLGLLKKTGGTGTSRLDAVMNNDGTLQIDTGFVDLARGGLSHGMFNAGAGNGLIFSGDAMTLEANAAVTIAGTVSFTGGTVNVNGGYRVAHTLVTDPGDVRFNGSATTTNVTLSSGKLQGTGTLVVEKTMTWTGGTMQGSGTTVIQSGAELVLSGAGDKTLNQRTLDNAGTLTWSGGTWLSGGTATILNQAAGVIDLQGDLTCAFNGYGSQSQIQNIGLVKKTAGAGASLLEIPLNNDGTLIVQSGTVTLTKGGDHHGVFQTEPGTTLNLAGGTMNLQAGASLTGAGTVQCSGSTVNVNGTVSASVSTLTLSAGTLGGGGTLTVDGTMTWTGGTMQGSGATVIQPGANLVLSGTGDKTLNQRTLDNAGTVTWSGGKWWSGGPATIRNQATGVIDLQGDLTCAFNGYGSKSQIQNLGLVKKTGGAGAGLLDIVFDHKGTLQACSGQLVVAGNLPQNASSVIEIQIGGLSPNAFGQAVIGGVAQFAGTLKVSLTGAFQPSPGDTIEILKFGSHTGAFDHISGLTAPNGIYFKPTFSATNVVLTALASRPAPAFDPVKVLSNRQVLLTMSDVAGDSLVISATTNLAAPMWTPILTNLDCAMAFRFIDADATNYPQRFFRAVRLP